jgi:hypothetical protein
MPGTTKIEVGGQAMSTNSGDNNTRVYYTDKPLPRYPGARIALVLLSIAMIAVLSSIVLMNWTDTPIVTFLAVLFTPIAAVFVYEIISELVILRLLPHMHYELRGDALYLILGAQWHSRITYNNIESATRKDLKNDMFSSCGFPKAGALDLIYADEGSISMYSTRLYKDVIVVKTKSGVKYGISPADSDGFLKELGQILDKERTMC